MAYAAKPTETESTYYHHTDRDSAGKIFKSGYIKQSTDTKNDARHGEGTNLTTLGPTESKVKIAQNNYDGRRQVWESKLGKTDVILEVKTTAEKCPGKRDIYKHDGDIPTKDIQKVYVRDDKGGLKEYTNYNLF